MVKVTYGSKFDGEPWSYTTARYELDALSCIDKTHTEIGDTVAAYVRQGATKVTVKVERL